ncbi:MAG: insulinase family protein [Spirochaetaceae bacterium]|nr:insulinase family protein [Spirochaetaceae bacterium]
MEKTTLLEGGFYKGFKVIQISEIPEYSCVGIWLKHENTSLEVFHMFCSDSENLFAFSFSTPPETSTGVAHILEHSVLCGSQKFPIKDPFIRLTKQSVKTFLNALTFSDKTVYPGASISEADYFNLMRVYGDAVFFPLLQKWTFEQEGHRLELDEKGNPQIQGVVYNEMKGNYSSFENIASDYILQTMLSGTVYDKDSGGNPEEIPKLSYEEFLAFHKKHYVPSNCKIFLYGNIPTEKQLDFIQTNFLDTFEKSSKENISTSANEIQALLSKYPIQFEKPVFLQKIGPASENGNKGSIVTTSWFLGDSSDPEQYMESILIAEILLGHDGSPLARALLESGLGQDIAPSSGLECEMHWILFTAGLRGVEKKNLFKVDGVIQKVLQELCQNGIPQEHIEAALQAVDFSQREVRRSHGPYSLVLMRRCLRGWNYGKSPFCTISNRIVFEKIKKHIATDDKYLQNLLKKLLLQNSCRSCLVVTPEKKYNRIRQKNEKELALRLLKQKSKVLVKKEQQQLMQLQQTEDSPEKLALIPHLSPKELSAKVNIIDTKRIEVANQVPLFLNQEPTNGIIYLDLGFPVDVLLPEEYSWLSFFAATVTDVGFGGKDWASTSAQIALKTGDFFANLFTSSCVDLDSEAKTDAVLGRDWIFFKVKALTENFAEALELLGECITSVDFSDTKRLSDLITEYRNELAASIIPLGNEYVIARASCKLSRSKAVDEIWNGLTQFYAMKKNTLNSEQIGQMFKGIMKRLLASGSVLHITADEQGLQVAKPLLNQFIHNYKIKAPEEKQKILELKDFCSITNIESSTGIEIFSTSTQVGFSATCCQSSPYGSTEAVHEGILAHWLTSTYLWEQIRTIGGAYGAFSWGDSVERVFSFSSYRDPKPFRSIDVFISALKEAINRGITEQELEKVITGCYSKEVQPKSPSGRGSVGFLRAIYGFSEEYREKKIRTILSTTPDDVIKAAKRVLEFMETSYSAVICGKKIDKQAEKTGNIITLPV